MSASSAIRLGFCPQGPPENGRHDPKNHAGQASPDSHLPALHSLQNLRVGLAVQHGYPHIGVVDGPRVVDQSEISQQENPDSGEQKARRKNDSGRREAALAGETIPGRLVGIADYGLYRGIRWLHGNYLDRDNCHMHGGLEGLVAEWAGDPFPGCIVRCLHRLAAVGAHKSDHRRRPLAQHRWFVGSNYRMAVKRCLVADSITKGNPLTTFLAWCVGPAVIECGHGIQENAICFLEAAMEAQAVVGSPCFSLGRISASSNMEPF